MKSKYFVQENVNNTLISHFASASSGGFRGDRAAPGPPLGDGLTPSLTVMLANANFLSFYYKTWYSEYSKCLPPVAF